MQRACIHTLTLQSYMTIYCPTTSNRVIDIIMARDMSLRGVIITVHSTDCLLNNYPNEHVRYVFECYNYRFAGIETQSA